jgi:hypothetical protein
VNLSRYVDGAYHPLVKRLAKYAIRLNAIARTLRKGVRVLVAVEADGTIGVYSGSRIVKVEVVHLPECSVKEEKYRQELLNYLLPGEIKALYDISNCVGEGNTRECLRLREVLWLMENDPKFSLIKDRMKITQSDTCQPEKEGVEFSHDNLSHPPEGDRDAPGKRESMHGQMLNGHAEQPQAVGRAVDEASQAEDYPGRVADGQPRASESGV